MKPLIEIQSVPISLEYKVTRPQMKLNNDLAQFEISRSEGGLNIKSRPIKLNVDTFDARNSVNQSAKTSIREFAEAGKQAAYDATARFVEEGQMLLDIHLKQDALGNIAAAKFDNQLEFGLGFIPSAPPNIDWTPADFTIRYEMDKLNFNWKIGQGKFEFIPGDIEFSIKEYNKVIIKYIGRPIYAPPSSDPEYVSLDAKA